MVTHSSILAWEIPWTERSLGAIIHRVTNELRVTEQLNNNHLFSQENKEIDPDKTIRCPVGSGVVQRLDLLL